MVSPGGGVRDALSYHPLESESGVSSSGGNILSLLVQKHQLEGIEVLLRALELERFRG